MKLKTLWQREECFIMSESSFSTMFPEVVCYKGVKKRQYFGKDYLT